MTKKQTNIPVAEAFCKFRNAGRRRFRSDFLPFGVRLGKMSGALPPFAFFRGNRLEKPLNHGILVRFGRFLARIENIGTFCYTAGFDLESYILPGCSALGKECFFIYAQIIVFVFYVVAFPVCFGRGRTKVI